MALDGHHRPGTGYRRLEDCKQSVGKHVIIKAASKQDEELVLDAGSYLRQTSEPLWNGTPGIMKASEIFCNIGEFQRQYLSWQGLEGLDVLPAWMNTDLSALHTFTHDEDFSQSSSIPLVEATSNEAQQPKLTDFQARVTIFKFFVGPAILFMPRAMANCGWAPALGFLAAAGMLSVKGMLYLAECHAATNESYAAMGSRAFGHLGYANVSIQIAISQFLFSTTGYIFEAHTVSSIFKTFQLQQPPYWTLIAAAFALKAPLGFIRKVQGMRYVAMAATVCVVVAVSYIAFSAFSELLQRGLQPHDTVRTAVQGGTLAYMGTAMYTFAGGAMVIPVQTSMEHPQHFPSILGTTVFGVAVLFAGFSLITYLAWGDTLLDVALNQPLEGHKFFLASLKAAYVVADVLNWCIMMYPTFNAVESFLFASWNQDAPSRRRTWAKNVVRTLLAALSALMANSCASILQILISLCGVLCCIPLALWIPGGLHWKLVRPTGLSQRLWDACLVIAGLAVTPLIAAQDLAMIAEYLQL